MKYNPLVASDWLQMGSVFYRTFGPTKTPEPGSTKRFSGVLMGRSEPVNDRIENLSVCGITGEIYVCFLLDQDKTTGNQKGLVRGRREIRSTIMYFKDVVIEYLRCIYRAQNKDCLMIARHEWLYMGVTLSGMAPCKRPWNPLLGIIPILRGHHAAFSDPL